MLFYRNQLDIQENLSLNPLNVATQIGFSAGNERENGRLQSEQSVSPECEYTALCPHTMMVITILTEYM